MERVAARGALGVGSGPAAEVDAAPPQVVVDEPALEEREEAQVDDEARAEAVVREELPERGEARRQVAELGPRRHAPSDGHGAHGREERAQQLRLAHLARGVATRHSGLQPLSQQVAASVT